MEKTKLSNQLYMYQFPPEEKNILGQNIFVLFEGRDCIVFDAGYEKHMEQLKPELSEYNIQHVICTHFHPDHCYGLNVLPKQQLIGSVNSIETLKMFDDLDNELLIPSMLIETETILKFGTHTISLVPNPGHSNCGMLIDIDHQFLLTGDEYITTNDNIPVLPYVAETIEQHKEALMNIVSNYQGYVLLPSHGVQTNNIEDYKYRIRYLDFAAKKQKDLSLFYREDDTHFLNERWHIFNIKND